MKILITGAGGFLGKSVLAAAVARGHQVRAMIRPASGVPDQAWLESDLIEIVRGDLRARGTFDEIVQGVDAVIHLAAAKAGDLYEQFAGTVLATENLLEAMRHSDVRQMVLTSSFSVYEYLKKRAWSVLDEESALAQLPQTRDEYCQTKLEQERIVREYFAERGGRCVILRPGVIFGRDNLWTARLGMQCGSRWWLRTGTFARLPLTYVENCAEAIVLAAEYQESESVLTLNVVDGECPNQRTYMREIRNQSAPSARIVPLPWTLMRLLARCADLTNLVFFKGTAKVPGLFVPSRLHARCKPLRYSNEKISRILKWTPRWTWRDGVRRSVEPSSPKASPPVESVSPESIEMSQEIGV